MNPGVRILVIDDHPLFREGLKSLLYGLDAHACVKQAASIAEALQLVGEPFDLILMDLHMPGTQGMEALTAIKTAFDEATVVVVSGEESPQVIQAAIQHGAAGYVPKSTDPSVTTQALRLVLAQGIYLPPEALRAPQASSHTHTLSDAPASPSAEAAARWSQELSPRQLAVLRCLLQGKPNKVIAREIGIAEGTVKAHLWAVYQLLGVNSRAQAMYRAHELKLFGALHPTAAPTSFASHP